jgi:hypothetical protein
MTDQVTMKTRILNEIRRSDLSAEASLAIATAIRYYENEPFWFNTDETAFATTSATVLYVLPTDFIGVVGKSFKLNDGTERKRLEPQSYATIDEWDLNSGDKGIPGHYAIASRKGTQSFRLFPAPDTAYTCSYQYICALNASVSQSSSGAWYAEGEELIRLHAKKDLYVNLIQGQEAVQYAQVLDSFEAAALARLKARNEVRSSPTIKARKIGW